MIRTKKITGWVEKRLFSRIQELRRRMPHAPTLSMAAAAALVRGLDVLAGRGIADQLSEFPETPGSKRALTLRLPRELHRRVIELSRSMPAASTPSAALSLALWVGVEELLRHRSSISNRETAVEINDQ